MRKGFYTLFLILFIGTSLRAQTLVNQAEVDTIGQAVYSSSYEAITTPDDSGASYLIGNQVTTSMQSGYVIAKIDNSGAVWVNSINNAPNTQTFLTGIYQRNAYLIATGYLLDSTINQASLFVARYSKATGDTLWTRTYFSGSWYSSGSAVIVSDSGYIFVLGTASVSATNYKMIVLKYDSLGNLLSTGGYDSVNMYSSGVAVALGSAGGVVVTGFTGSGFGSWNFVSASFNSNCGLLSVAQSSNGSGSFISRPVAIFRDPFGNIRVVGTAATTGNGSSVKLIEYDSAFNQQKVSIYGDSIGSTIVATNAINDQNGHILITGSASNNNGGADMIALNFNDNPGDSSDGTLNWSKRISAPDPTKQAVGVSLTTDDNNNVIVSGKIFKNGHWGMVTNALDINTGTQLWGKTYKRANNTDDSATAVIFDGTNIEVFGTSEGPTNTIYNRVQYQQWTAQDCSLFKDSTLCNNITYNFKNGQITYAGTDTFVEFDIYAKQSDPTVGFKGADIYFTYSTDVFGKLIVDSNEITVTKGTIINDTTTYLLVVNDTLLKSDAVPVGGSEIHLAITTPTGGTKFIIADTLQKLCHVK